MAFAFISYSSADRQYVEVLVGELNRRQLDFWYDRRIDSGHRWTQDVEANIRSCAVFVPVLTSRFDLSQWCQRELHLADRLGKPMAPLLLAGEMPFPLITLQYEDVADGGIPSERWFLALAAQLAAEDRERASSAAPARDTSQIPNASTTEAHGGVQGATAVGVPSNLSPASAPARRAPDAAAVSRWAAFSSAVQRLSTLVCFTALGLALIYLVVLSPELGMRRLGVAAVALAAVASLSCLFFHYSRGVPRRRRLDDREPEVPETKEGRGDDATAS